MDPYSTPAAPYIFSRPHSDWVPLNQVPPRACSALSLATALRLYTWNIDFTPPGVVSRLHGVLEYLSVMCPSPEESTIILLQEVSHHALPELLRSHWVRNNFLVTDIKPVSGYMTLTLFSRNIDVRRVHRLRFEDSWYERDCLFVDIALENSRRVLRVGNTHLESLPPGEHRRFYQLAAISRVLKEPGVKAGVVAGDMNPISIADETYTSKPEVALRDVWDLTQPDTEPGFDTLDLRTGADKGHTWGYQPSCTYPPRRFDKVLYTGNVGFSPVERGSRLLSRLGVGVVCRNEDEDAHPAGAELWLSDHFGLAVGVGVGRV